MSHSRDNNPFYTNDNDDELFGGPRGGGFGSSSVGRDPFQDDDFGGRPLSRYEQLQQMKENSMNRQIESTTSALASIYDSEAMGVATAEELLEQGEQLDNAETKLDKINQDMKTSQKHLNSIKSVFGGIKNWWQGKDKQSDDTSLSQPQKTQSKPSDGLQKALDSSISSGAKSGPHPSLLLKSDDGRGFYDDDDLDSKFLGAGSRRYDQIDGPSHQPQCVQQLSQQRTQTNKSSLTQADDQFHENLDMMSDGMSRLKGLAIGLGDEIGRQNDQVDRVQGKADRADIRLKDQNRQMRTILK